MKKIIFIFLTLFIFIPNSPALSKFHIAEKVPNMHIESVRDIGIHNGVPFIIRRDDGQFVYCLERPKDVNENEYYDEYTYNNKLFNLTEEQLDRINLIAYYGYQYLDHTDIKWYGVTQFLIWGTLYQDVYFTDTRYGNRIDAYVSEVREIESLISKYYTLPSFSYESFNYSINTTYEILDLNGVLNNYEIKSSNIDTYIYNNKLYVNTNEEGNYEINFIRKSPIKEDYILYWLNDSQPLIRAGKIKDIEFKININVSSGSITINKVDSENTMRDFATLEGAEYGIYNNDNKLITTIKTNENGIAFIDKLPWNQKYYIRELVPSSGYKLDENTYEVRLTKDEKNITINSYENIIEGNLIINKYYGKDGSYEIEDGAIFEIYDMKDKLIGAYETENGIINVKLEYGKYYIIQKDGIEGYKLSNKKHIEILEEKDYELNLYNEKIEGNLIINKYYGEDKNYELEDGAIFEIYDIKDKLIGAYETENGRINVKLEYGEYYGIQTNGISGYSFVDKFNISIKEEKDYILDLYNEKEQEGFIIVEVPDTKKIDYDKLISIIFIVIGLVLVFKSMKKTTR